ncbi:MAG: hypothetical protein H6Q90_4640 [Deltaproteobacteria bacterium]|nr:hypothetical protein [Deltaproteobacteria bacterium]
MLASSAMRTHRSTTACALAIAGLALVALALVAACRDKAAQLPPPAAGDAGGARAITPRPAMDARATTELAQACAAYANGLCAALERCAPHLVRVNHGDAAACRTNEQRGCRVWIAPDESNATQGSILACTPGPETACDRVVNTSADACLVPGPAPIGGACAVSAQCQSRFCDRAKGRWCGTCGELPGKGQRCIDDVLCEGDLRCNDGRCTEPRSIGERCSPLGCKDGLACRDERCVAPGNQGAKCLLDSDCVTGLLCDSDTSRCVPGTVSYAEVGQPCGDGIDCVGDAICDRVCVALGRAGDRCGDEQRCGALLHCIEGRCGMLDPARCR